MVSPSYCTTCEDNGASANIRGRRCLACGRWKDGRWIVSNLGWVLLSLLAFEGVALLVFRLWVIPGYVSLFQDLDAVLPLLTILVISWWWVPLCLVALMLKGLLALHVTQTVRSRDISLGVSVLIGAILLAFTFAALSLPLRTLTTMVGP